LQVRQVQRSKVYRQTNQGLEEKEPDFEFENSSIHQKADVFLSIGIWNSRGEKISCWEAVLYRYGLPGLGEGEMIGGQDRRNRGAKKAPPIKVLPPAAGRTRGEGVQKQ
jgi:hypothetical protein